MIKMNPMMMPGISLDRAGFEKLHSFGSWRIMTSTISQQERPTVIQKHNCTDEVFILLKGKGFVLLGECQNNLEACPMEAGNGYVVPKGVWHAHILEAGSQLLIVENEDTSLDNSPIVRMQPEQIEAYLDLIE